jgi:hypothetical protein
MTLTATVAKIMQHFLWHPFDDAKEQHGAGRNLQTSFCLKKKLTTEPMHVKLCTDTDHIHASEFSTKHRLHVDNYKHGDEVKLTEYI